MSEGVDSQGNLDILLPQRKVQNLWFPSKGKRGGGEAFHTLFADKTLIPCDAVKENL